jgi:subtilisin family serine protease
MTILLLLLIVPSKGYTKLQKDKKLTRKEILNIIRGPQEKTSQKTKSFYNERELSGRYANWGIDPSSPDYSIHLKEAWNIFKKKQDVHVAVVDTGIDPKHPFFKNSIYNSEGSNKANPKNYGVDFSKGSGDQKRTMPFDQHGHGTHVTGIIKAIYPDVKVTALKYYEPTASGLENLNATIAALDYAVEKKVDMINYSGGGPEASLEELKILRRAQRSAILVVAASGNEKSDLDIRGNEYYPASYGLDNIISVTAHDKRLQTLPSSNVGKKSVDISAPGKRIRSALPYNRSGYLTGTSQATAFVTGVASLIRSKYPSYSCFEIKEIIKKSASKFDSLKDKTSSGGALNAYQALLLADKKSNQTKN